MRAPRAIFVAGHRGLVGSAIVPAPAARGLHAPDPRTRARARLCATRPRSRSSSPTERPRVRVPGRGEGRRDPREQHATRPISSATTCAIQTNVIDAAYRHGVQQAAVSRFELHLSEASRRSRCRRTACSPGRSNRPTSGMRSRRSPASRCARRTAGSTASMRSRSMPTNLYGPGDNFDLETSHVLPALIRKFHEAKARGDRRSRDVWGTGTPRREFLSRRRPRRRLPVPDGAL